MREREREEFILFTVTFTSSAVCVVRLLVETSCKCFEIIFINISVFKYIMVLLLLFLLLFLSLVFLFFFIFSVLFCVVLCFVFYNQVKYDE